MPVHETRTIVIGHRNPDTDCCASAAAYAELKHKLGATNVIAASAGYAGARTEFLFKKFNIPLPKVIEDVSPRARDVMDVSPRVVFTGQTLLEAMEYIQESKMSRIPVTNPDGSFIGMICLFDLAARMFQKSRDIDTVDSDIGIMGRSVETSIHLAAKSLNARVFSAGQDHDKTQHLKVYVGAMSLERLRSDILPKQSGNIAIVVGDRNDVHRMLIEQRVPLLIVTHNAPIDLDLIQAAKENHVSVLQTPYDSATAVRRLKFSQPVESMVHQDSPSFSPNDKLSDIYQAAKNLPEDLFPIVNNQQTLLGCVAKSNLSDEPPINLILVDHNEFDQAVHGAEETPVVEIIDHHRIGVSPTNKPITMINDVVGSCSTLITEQYRRFGVDPSSAMAGVLMGGICSDTLLLRSPTSTDRDKIALEYLRKINGTDPKQLIDEIFSVGSVIATQSPRDAILSDKKDYKTNQYRFSISQVEETDFENFKKSQTGLLEELERVQEEEELDLALLLVTDVIREDSLLLTAGKKQLLNALPYEKSGDRLYKLPEILSRKKQLLPALLKAFEER